MATSVLKPPSCYQTTSVQSANASVTVRGNSTGTATITGNLSGWYPIGVVGIYQSQAALARYSYTFSAASGTATVSVGVRNTGSSSITATVTAYILWRKE